MHWVQQVYYRTIRITKILGRREHDCQVVVNMGADRSNLSLFKTSIFTLVLLSTETFAQIVQNGGFESGKWSHSSPWSTEEDDFIHMSFIIVLAPYERRTSSLLMYISHLYRWLGKSPWLCRGCQGHVWSPGHTGTFQTGHQHYCLTHRRIQFCWGP